MKHTSKSINVISKSVSWRSLKSVYDDKKIRTTFELLEKRLSVIDESTIFKRLVNMSTADEERFHRWIRYREGYAGELVKEILRRFPIDSKTGFVLDPMCGSGSTVVACGELGIDALGLDVSGYAVLATKVKSHNYTSLEAALIAATNKRVARLELGNVCKVETSLQHIGRYFPKTNYHKLLLLRDWIAVNISDPVVLDFFNLALLAIAEECSNRKKDGNGLVTRPSPVSNVQERFIIQLKIMLDDIVAAGMNQNSTRTAKECSALESQSMTRLFAGRIRKELGSIIFSPPYANSFDYFESYKLELNLGGFVSGENIQESKKKLIRNYRIIPQKNLVLKLDCVERLCNEILQKIPVKEAETGTTDGRTRLVPNMLRAYFEDMGKVISIGLKTLADGGRMHIVIDQSSYVGVPIPTDLIFAMIAEEAGFEVEKVIKCRRANTSGQQLKKFPYLKALLRESIVTLRKPVKNSPIQQ